MSESVAPTLPVVDKNIEPKLALWYASDHHAQWLDSVLFTPEGQLLLDVIAEKAIPRTSAESLYLITGEISIIERMVLSQASHSGIAQVAALIRGLSTRPRSRRQMPRQMQGA